MKKYESELWEVLKNACSELVHHIEKLDGGILLTEPQQDDKKYLDTIYGYVIGYYDGVDELVVKGLKVDNGSLFVCLDSDKVKYNIADLYETWEGNFGDNWYLLYNENMVAGDEILPVQTLANIIEFVEEYI